jgi:hypothetical protein
MTTFDRSDPSARPIAGVLDEERARTVIDQEQRLVVEAIELVARGSSQRVTLAGLRYAEAVIETARPLALERRVRLVALWTDDERGADVAVEAVAAWATTTEIEPDEPILRAASTRAAARSSV